MDSKRREDLVAKIKQQEQSGTVKGLPLVSLEDFFIGNDDISSIGCNLSASPGPQVFFQTLLAIRSKPNVQDVLVEIMEVDEEQDDWPFSERVYIFAEATVAEVETWVKPLQADDVCESDPKHIPVVAPSFELNKKVFSIWWD